MFAHSVSMLLKPDSAAGLSELMQKNFLPLLRNQKGFEGAITFVALDGEEAVAISLWDHSESAEAYGRETYPKALNALGKTIEGTRQVHTYEVSQSTFHGIGSPAL